jgi:hypothetical protein
MDCEELAAEEGFINKWETAMHYASLMLPAIFRPTDPIMQVHFSSNDRIELEEIISGLEDSIFKSDDALGWVYQFWQSEEKDRINKSGNKIDGESLPAVTQLFTEQYMVDFLIDNTLGAWWVSRHPGVEAPVKFEYLRLLEDGTPAAGKFEGWPDKTSEVTSLDPCMGSGHFITSLFPVFAKLRMWEEKLTKEEATDKVIRENLHGLEIDARCTQIAAFNLALAAWKFCGQYRRLPEMNLACSGIAPKGKEEDWVKLVGKVHRDDQIRMENGMRQLFRHFQLAPELGSLLDPTTIQSDIETAGIDLLYPILEKALISEVEGDQLERGVMAAGIAKAGILLSKEFHLVITNVPYLQQKRFSETISKFVEKNYKSARTDLATTFIQRLNKQLQIHGKLVIVSPGNWISQDYYKKFRSEILKKYSLNFIIQLGSGAFSQITGEVVKPILYCHFKTAVEDNNFFGLDISDTPSIDAKINSLRLTQLEFLLQEDQKNNPDNRITTEKKSEFPLLSEFADFYNGITTGDILRFTLNFWEVDEVTNEYEFFRSTFKATSSFKGCEGIIKWENGNGRFHSFVKDRLGEKNISQWIRIESPILKNGVIISAMGNLPSSIYTQTFFDSSSVVLVPKEEGDLKSIWAFVSSSDYSTLVRSIDKSLKVTGPLIKVPFDKKKWKEASEVQYPNELPLPYSNDPNQWLFHGNPKVCKTPLQVAIGRLLGYRWPAESDPEMELDPEAHFHIQDIQAFDHLSDEDGIFCIPSVNGEAAGADRLRDYIQAVWGETYAIDTLNQLLEKEDATSKNLENWLRDEFFLQHCKVFNNRPFIWQIWDGRKDGFSVLVNYHKLTKNNLSKLIYTYLGDWIRMCESKKRSGESGADGMLSAALKLKESLELILEGEQPYDIFVRWKPLSEQLIGWNPDLNDGVRLNIRPFVEAGILRKKFNVKWGTDRGRNPPGSHWGEERDNDVHLSLEEKRRAKNL